MTLVPTELAKHPPLDYELIDQREGKWEIKFKYHTALISLIQICAPFEIESRSFENFFKDTHFQRGDHSE